MWVSLSFLFFQVVNVVLQSLNHNLNISKSFSKMCAMRNSFMSKFEFFILHKFRLDFSYVLIGFDIRQLCRFNLSIFQILFSFFDIGFPIFYGFFIF
jgi:hypothetical protein